MILLALGFFGGIVLTAAAVLIPGRLLSVPDPDGSDTDDDTNGAVAHSDSVEHTGEHVDPGDHSNISGDGHD